MMDKLAEASQPLPVFGHRINNLQSLVVASHAGDPADAADAPDQQERRRCRQYASSELPELAVTQWQPVRQAAGLTSQNQTTAQVHAIQQASPSCNPPRRKPN